MTCERRSFGLPLAAALLFAPAAFAADAGSIDAQGPDQWRASKLAGVPIYGPGDKKVGDVTDVMMSHDGRAAFVIIGVGGFLGIGEKDVAVPFDQVTFTDVPRTPPAPPVPVNASAANGPSPAVPGPGAMAPTGGPAPAATTGLGTPGDTLGTPTAPAMAGAMGTPPAALPPTPIPAPRNTAAPDHGTVNLTADQLKGAPTFHFAR